MPSSPSCRAHWRAATSAAALICVLSLILVARVDAAPAQSGAVGGSWRTVDQAPLADQRITALLADAAGGLWAGTEERGLARWDGQAWRMLDYVDGLADDRVVALFADAQGHLWVSTGTGLGYLPVGGGSFRHVPLKGLPSLPVLAIGQAQDGGVLLGGPSGLAVWHPDGALKLAPELAGKRVFALHTARDGVTWVGTSAGLWRSAGLGWQHDERVGGAVTAFAEGPDGRFCLTSDGGVWELEAGSWTQLQPGAAGPFTSASLHNGTLWLGGLAGLVAGQGQVWQSYDARLLPGPTVTSLAWTSDGRLWVGTSAGLAVHEPDVTAPKITLRSINGELPASGWVALDVDRIDRIDVAGEDAGRPDGQLRYFVRLEGVEDTPRLLTAAEAADPAAIAAYAGRRLAAGTYTLRAWVEDDAFNRSSETQAKLLVPALAHLPAGLAVRSEAVYAGVAGLALLLTAGATTRTARQTRRRQIAYAAEAATARVRGAISRSGELYASPVPLREAQVREALAALPGEGVLLLGAKGMGKTDTLGRIALALAAGGTASLRLVPALVDLGAVAEDGFFGALISAASAALYPLAVGSHPRLNWMRAAPYGEQAFSADLGVLLAWLQPQRSERVVLVLLLDDAERIDGYAGTIRDAFRRLVVASSPAASPVRLVLSSKEVPAVVEGFSDLFQHVVLAPLGGTAATQLLREGARGIVGWDPEAERLAVERAAGSPARLVAFGRASALSALANSRLAVSAADLPATDAP